jgi:nitrite reductase/ring-hydroxylating ferredoxin subunit
MDFKEGDCMRYTICKRTELSPGNKKIVDINKKSIVVICTNDNEYYAVRNICPHQGAELGLGNVGGTILAGKVGEHNYARHNEIIRCPWHGFEFDCKTGCTVHDQGDLRIKTYDVVIESDHIVVHM